MRLGDLRTFLKYVSRLVYNGIHLMGFNMFSDTEKKEKKKAAALSLMK